MVSKRYGGLLTVVQENILMAIRGEGLADDDGGNAIQEERVVYVLHPDCAVEDMG